MNWCLCWIYLSIVLVRFANGQVRMSADLNCDFSNSCRWHNGTGPEIIGWTHTNDIMPDNRFPAGLPDRGNDFIYSNAPPGMHRIELVSDIISCQLGGAKLSFWYFYSGSRSQVELCTRWPPGSQNPAHWHCYETSTGATRSQQWALASIELPPISQSMELIIRATFEPPNDVVAIDDIKYEAILCESTHRVGSASSGGGEIDEDPNVVLGSKVRQIPSYGNILDSSHEMIDTPVHQSVDSIEGGSEPPRSPFHGMPNSVERIESDNGKRRHQPATEHSNCGVDCDFDLTTFCSLVSPNITDSNTAPWIMSKSALLNPLTGIEADISGKGFFACTVQDPGHDQRFVLGTRNNFSLIEPSTLQFSYYMAGIRGRLRVCTDYPLMQECPFLENGTEMTADWRQWRTAMVKLKPGKTSVHFVADQLTKNYLIGLDDIRLLDKYARLPAICDQKSTSTDYFA